MPAAPSDTTFDVVALGNALVDVISHEADDFLAEHDLVKGSMQLIDEARADELYRAMGPGTEMSGGSAANTIAGVASFGGRAAFVGKVRDDTFGAVFRHDLRAAGVTFDSPAATTGPSTGRCLVVVTSDAERTMSTFLGAGQDMGPGHLDAVAIAAAEVTYLEGYLWDQPVAKEAYRAASRVAHDAGRLVALTLSDPLCVARHRDEWTELIAESVDVVFGNEEEVAMLYELPFDAAVDELARHTRVAAVTRGAKGSLVTSQGGVHEIAAAPVDPLVDTTGAGDLYAAGFLFGFTSGRPLPECGRLGALAAAEVISHTGARPLAPLASLL